MAGVQTAGCGGTGDGERCGDIERAPVLLSGEGGGDGEPFCQRVKRMGCGERTGDTEPEAKPTRGAETG